MSTEPNDPDLGSVPAASPPAAALHWLKRDAAGLVTVVVQDRQTGMVRMVAHADAEAITATMRTGLGHFFSRSRQRLWMKGEESGHAQQVHEIRMDCDSDVLLLKVTQLGHDPSIACHTGRHSCFFQLFRDGAWQTVEPVLKDPSTIYT